MKIAVLGDGITAKAVKSKINDLNKHQIVDINNAEVIVASPGIPPDNFPETSKPIISEIELACRLLSETAKPPKLIGITGTNGKTTITSMISKIMNCPVAGNIGQTLISHVPTTKEQENEMPEYIAVELSSYQLETTHTLKPKVSIIANITEDHLAWHKTFENYILAKIKIFQNQDNSDLFIYNQNDEITKKHIHRCKAKTFGFNVNSDRHQIKAHLKLPGEHNLENAMAALECALFCNIPLKTILEKLSEFSGVEHRIEYIGNIKGANIYNDSKATNPESTITAIKALGKKGIIILGGKDKNTSLKQLCDQIKNNIEHVVLIGEASSRFELELRKSDYDKIFIEKDMKSAVNKCVAIARDENYILLSPACASFDMYSNYESRGEDFKKIVADLEQDYDK